MSDWPEKTAVMNDYCFGVSKSFVSKISVLSNMMFCWFMSRYTTGLQGISEGMVSPFSS